MRSSKLCSPPYDQGNYYQVQDTNFWPHHKRYMARGYGKGIVEISTRLVGDRRYTNTVQFMDIEEIAHIPKGNVITYAHIVVNYGLQKEDKIMSGSQREKI